MLGIVLLYVGAVLFLNGIWLLGWIEDREIFIMNVFTGGLGVVIAIVAIIQGGAASFQLAGLVLLFAFTYLWVAWNRFIPVSGHGLGWYSLFVAITAVPTGIFTLLNSQGETANLWLAADWFAWAVLWFVYFLLLALRWPVLKLAGWLTLFEGVATSWALGYLLLLERLVLV